MENPRSLQSLISRSFLTSSVVPILVIEVLLLLLYFGINSYITSRNKLALLDEVTLSLQEVSRREVATINAQFQEVSRYARIIQKDHQRFFADSGYCLLPIHPPEFGVHENGAYYKLSNNGGSSLYFSSSTKIGPTELRKARCSEVLDPLLASIVDGSPIITQAYFNTWDNMNRLYPFMPDAPGQYGPTLRMQDYNFYFAADAAHNAERKPVWTGAYLDPAGQGWMVSNIVPIYHGDFLEGVSGLDVTIDSFVRNILTLTMPWDSKVFMVDEQGMILAMPESVELLLGLKELKKHVYSENILATISKPEEYKILHNRDAGIQSQLQNIFVSKARIAQMEIAGTGYLVSQEIVPETGWRMITLVDESSIFAQIYHLERLTKRIGYLAIAIMVFFYLVFFFLLQRKASKLSTLIAAPIEKLSQLTSDMGSCNLDSSLDAVGIAEIDKLSRNYNDMVCELEKRTRDLVEVELREKIAEKEAELLETLAATDQLTGLANRYKLDEALAFEIERYQRSERAFGVIMMDIDHFKMVNDSYGHQVGDRLLVEIASLLKRNIRKTDLIGRWGGEEFLIVCPETSREGGLELAEHLRKAIETHRFAVVKSKTASFGVTLSQKNDQINDLVGRADKALYQAKANGRNVSVFL